jgi:hypothetical protein
MLPRKPPPHPELEGPRLAPLKLMPGALEVPKQAKEKENK